MPRGDRGPGGGCGFSIEPELVSSLLNDLSEFAPWDEQAADRSSQANRLLRRADQLPLLQHALNRLWIRAARGDGRIVLRLKDYVDIGGLRGAIDLHADEVIEGLGPDRLPIVEKIFRALTDGSTVAEAVRRPTKLSNLAATAEIPESEVRAVVEPFLAQGCNFLSQDPPGPLTSDTFVDISHESLIRQWSRLSKWLQAEARSAESIRRIDAAATRRAQGQGELLQGLDLANLLEWRGEENPTAEWASRYVGEPVKALAFLEQSRVQARKKRQRTFALGAATASVVLLALLAGVALAFEMRHGRALEAERAKAEEARVEAQSQRDKAEGARTDAQAQRDSAESARSEAEAARVDAQKQRDAADSAGKKYAEILEQARSAFLSSAVAQSDQFQSAGDYAKAGNFLAAVIGVSRTANGEIDGGVLGSLMPRLVEQIAVGSAFPSDTHAVPNHHPVLLRLDRPGKFQARVDEDSREIQLIDGETGLEHARFALENGGKIATTRIHYVSRDGSAMILVGEDGELFLWLKGDYKALFVPDPEWLGRRAYSYAYNPGSGVIAALYCEFGTDFLAATSRDGRIRVPPMPLFELSGDRSSSMVSNCLNDAANSDRKANNQGDETNAHLAEQSRPDTGAASEEPQLIAATVSDLILTLAQGTADDTSTGLVAYNPKRRESEWLVAPGRLKNWKEGLDSVSLVVTIPREACNKSLSISFLATPTDESEPDPVACFITMVPGDHRITGEAIPLPAPSQPNAFGSQVMRAVDGPSWALDEASSRGSLATLIGWETVEPGAELDQNSGSLRVARAGSDGLEVLQSLDSAWPIFAWGHDAFETATHFDHPKSEDNEAQDGFRQRRVFAISTTSALELHVDENDSSAQNWLAWMAPGQTAAAPSLTFIDKKQCEGSRAKPDRDVSASPQNAPSQEGRLPQRTPHIAGFGAYGSRNGEFIAFSESEDGPAAVWHLALHAGDGTVQATVTCIGKMPESGEFLGGFPGKFEQKITHLVWGNEHAVSVLSLTDQGDGAPPKLSPPEPLALSGSEVQSAVTLADGSIAVLTSEGDLAVFEYQPDRWAQSPTRSITHLLNVKGRYALATRDNLILAADRVSGDWWRAYVVDVEKSRRRILAAGALPNLGEHAQFGLLDPTGAVVAIDDGLIITGAWHQFRTRTRSPSCPSSWGTPLGRNDWTSSRWGVSCSARSLRRSTGQLPVKEKSIV
jgi:hypothetical protein